MSFNVSLCGPRHTSMGPHTPTAPSDDDIVMRYSLDNSLEMCGGREDPKYVKDPGYIKIFGANIVFGNLVHAGIEEMLRGHYPVFVLQEKYLVGLAERILDEEYGPEAKDVDWRSIIPKDGLQPLVEEAQTALALWARDLESMYPPELAIAIERDLLMPLGEVGDGRWVWLRGTPDAIFEMDGISWAADWKTSTRGWKNEKAQFSKQPNFYMALVAWGMGKDITNNWNFCVYVRQKQEWLNYFEQRTSDQITAVLKGAYRRGLQVAHGIYTITNTKTEFFKDKRAWYCSPKWCPSWNPCEFKYLNDKVDESEVATYTW